jgi:hypothetical protein
LTTHTNIHGKKILIPDNHKREKRQRITQDQKKIRALSYLQSKNETVGISELLEKITKNTMSRSGENTAFLEKMKTDELIILKRMKGVSHGYEISEKGKKLIDLIKLIKKCNANNPIFLLDLFQMTEDEKKVIERSDDGSGDFEKIFEFKETNENFEKIKEDLGFNKIN